MLKREIRRLVLAACLALLPQAAQASVIQYDFDGVIGFIGNDLPVHSFVNVNDPISGFLRYDDSAAYFFPGRWRISDALFHVHFDSMYFEGDFVQAHLDPARRSIIFNGAALPHNVPFGTTGISLELTFDSGINGFFSPYQLPSDVPPGHNRVIVTLSGNWGDQDVASDANLNVQVGPPSPPPVPEPLTVFLVLGGMALVILRHKPRLCRADVARQRALKCPSH